MDWNIVYDGVLAGWKTLHDDQNLRETLFFLATGFGTVGGLVWKYLTREKPPKPATSGIAKETLPPLVKRLNARRNDRAKEIAEMANVFSNLKCGGAGRLM